MNQRACECGCGQPTPLAKRTNRAKGHMKGQPIRFVPGHFVRIPLADRFWPGVDRRGDNDCWLWTRCKSGNGYGGGVNRSLAHRMAWELTNGPIPPGMYVCHTCDVRTCCNPKHLFLGTQRDNVADMMAKGRNRPGLTKLSADDVVAIRNRASLPGYSRSALAVEYGVHPRTIWLIVTNRKRLAV